MKKINKLSTSLLRMSSCKNSDTEKKWNANIIVVNSNCYHGYSIKDAIKGIAECGYRYVELTATEGWTEHVSRTQAFEELCEIREMLKEYDLVPIALSGHINIMDNDRVEDFIKNIQLADFFGCGYIVTSIGEAHLEDKSLASMETIAEHIHLFLPYLEEYDMVLTLEIHGNHANGEILKEICKLVNSQYVKINYDTANAIYWGGMSEDEMVADVANCIDDVAYMHIKDKLGAKKEWNFPALGHGNIPFDNIFHVLNEHNNQCPLSIEIEFTANGSENIEEVNQALKDSAEFLVNHGYSLK